MSIFDDCIEAIDDRELGIVQEILRDNPTITTLKDPRSNKTLLDYATRELEISMNELARAKNSTPQNTRKINGVTQDIAILTPIKDAIHAATPQNTPAASKEASSSSSPESKESLLGKMMSSLTALSLLNNTTTFDDMAETQVRLAALENEHAQAIIKNTSEAYQEIDQVVQEEIARRTFS